MRMDKEQHDQPTTWWETLLKGGAVFLGVLTISVSIGYGKAQYDIKNCLGMADTTQCHRERAKEKALELERTKEQH